MLRLRNHTPEGRILGTLREQPAMKKEYDFTEGVRGKYVKRPEKETNLVPQKGAGYIFNYVYPALFHGLLF